MRPVVRRRAPRPVRSGARGFSLLEVLVAFVVVAVLGTALFRLFGGALANAGAADEYSRALLVADSVLAEAATAPLRETTRTGRDEDGRIEWKAVVSAYPVPDPGDAAGTARDLRPVQLYRIAVDVAFPSPSGGTRTIALSTLRIGPRETVQ